MPKRRAGSSPVPGTNKIAPNPRRTLLLTGGLAFTLGALGFVVAVWYVRRPEYAAAPGETSYRADAWVRAIADAGYAASASLSRIQSGVLTRYVFGSVVAVAAILLIRVSLR